MKKINRRKFIIKTAQGVTGLGFLAGCDSRIPVGDDIRPPSAPQGLTSESVEYLQNTKRVTLSWTKHDNTDITGAISQKQIIGYNIYRTDSLFPLNTNPVTATTFVDEGNLTEGNWYTYQATAIDQNNNESPKSKACNVLIVAPAPVYKITSNNALTGIKLNPDEIKRMVHAGVKSLTGINDVGEAYKSLFSGITLSSIIAIKINCLAAPGLCTHPQVVEAIIDGLKQMSINNSPFPLHNIIVFDDREESKLKSAGFALKDNPGDYRVLTTINSWSTTISTIGDSQQRFSTVAEEADYIINVPVLKDHSNAGITFSLKNFFGIIDKPQNMHTAMCDPYIASVYKIVSSKVALIVGDAVFGAHKGGPYTSATFVPKTILIAKDPVAIDKCALDMINNERKKSSNTPVISLKPDPTQPDARHITTAGALKYNLGRLNYKIIDVPV